MPIPVLCCSLGLFRRSYCLTTAVLHYPFELEPLSNLTLPINSRIGFSIFSSLTTSLGPRAYRPRRPLVFFIEEEARPRHVMSTHYMYVLLSSASRCAWTNWVICSPPLLMTSPYSGLHITAFSLQPFNLKQFTAGQKWSMSVSKLAAALIWTS